MLSPGLYHLSGSSRITLAAKPITVKGHCSVLQVVYCYTSIVARRNTTDRNTLLEGAEFSLPFTRLKLE